MTDGATKRVVVTGAGGFVAGHLVPYLAEAGFSVIAVSRNPSLTFAAPRVTVARPPDSETGWTALLSGADGVVHLAGVAHQEAAADDHDRVNRVLTARIATAASRAGVAHFVFISSILAQSASAADHVLMENDVPRPTGAYGQSKLAGEQAVAAAGVPFTILRPVVISGVGVKGNVALLERLAGLPVPLPFGAMTGKRSMVSTDSFNAAIETVLFNPRAFGETFIVADPEAMTLGEMIAAARRHRGRAPHLFNVSPGLLQLVLRSVGRGEMWERMNGALVADSSKLQALGWMPKGPKT